MTTELEDQLRAKKVAILKQTDATLNKEKQQKLQQQKEILEREKQIAELQKQQDLEDQQLAKLAEEQRQKEAKIAELEKQTANEEEAKRIAIEKQQQQEKLQQEAAIAGREQLVKATNEKIQKLQSERDAEIANIIEHNPPWVTKRSQLESLTSEVRRRYSPKIEAEKRNLQKAIDLYNYSLAFNDRPLTQTELRKYEGGSESLIHVVENQLAAQKAQAEFNRKSSQTTAQSNAVLANIELEKTVREFEAKRDTTANQLNESMQRLTQIKEVQKATKSKPGIMPSSYFAESELTPVSIIGNTKAQSNDAIETYGLTQAQQKKLFQEITHAADYKQATKLKQKAMDLNPYVGTPNSLLYRGGLVASSGVLIEKKLNSKPILTYEPILESDTTPKEINTDIMPNQDIPRPDMLPSLNMVTPKPSLKFAGTLQYVYEINQHKKQEKLAEEIKAAGGTYNDYLKTVNKNSIDYQIKSIGLGAKRAFNSYTSLVGVQILNPKLKGHSLIDLAFTDIYNSLYEPVIKPAKSTLEKLGIKVAPAPANPKPFEQTTKAFNERSPAENLGDILTVAAVETSIAIGTSGLGNLALRGATKFPMLLKAKPVITKTTPGKESQIASIQLEDGSKVKVTNFDYVEPPPKPRKRIIKPAPGLLTKKIKVDGKKITVIDNDATAKAATKAAKETAPKKSKKGKILNSKLIRTIAISTPSTKKITDIATKLKEQIPKEFDVVGTMEKKIINTDIVRKTAQSKILNPKKKDKGKKQFAESGLEYNRVQREFIEKYAIEHKPTKQNQVTTLIQKNKTQKTTRLTQIKRKQSNVTVVEEILHPNRPKMTRPVTLTGLVKQGVLTDTLTSQKQRSSMKLEEQSKSILKNLLEEKLKTSEKIKEKQKSKLKTVSTYSLIVTPGLKGRFNEISATKAKAMLQQKQIVRIKKNPRIAPPPSIKIKTIDDRPNSRKPSRKRRENIIYSTWNVDIERIGTLPGQELNVSKSKKVFKQLDELQKRTHSKPFKKNSKRKSRKGKSKKKSSSKK